MKTLYGHFDDEQLEQYKVYLHKQLFWLLLYKDPNTCENFGKKGLDFDLFFNRLMSKLDGFNEILLYPDIMVSIMSILQAAYNETLKEDFNYREYRSLVLEAHSLLDKLKWGDAHA